jgi:uncharacterized membrane protein YgcG
MLKRLILAGFLCVLTLAAAGARERITRFVSDVDVQRNGDLVVTETIQVMAEGDAIRHGILRDFPTTYRTKDGARVRVGFDVLEVKRDGASEHYTSEPYGNGVRLRIGDAHRYINGGAHEFVIKYRTTRQIGFFKSFDELYWNVTGTGWAFPIDMAEARINLPARVAFTQTALYTGPDGAHGKDAQIVAQQPGRIVFRTTKGLPYRNGLTVAAAWPKGVVAPPNPLQRLQALLADYPPGQPAALFGGGLVILFYLMAWLAVGRDPRRGTVIPIYAPPEGMSAAAVRYVDTMICDNRCFAAAIIGLGVNGHIKLTGAGGDGEIKHVKSDKPLDAAEKAVEHKLFKENDAVRLDQSDADVINDAKLALWRTLSKTYAGKLFSENKRWSAIGFFASAAVVALIGHAFVTSYREGAGMTAAMAVPLIPIMIGAVAVRNGWRYGGLGGWLRIVGGLVFAGLLMALGVFMAWAKAPNMQAVAPAFAAFVLAPFAVLGFHWLQAPNALGRKIMDQIDGFKLYLSVAEKDRLNFDNPPKETPELFERYLPYAIALDVQNAWAERFAGVLAAAAMTGAGADAWCEDRRWRDDPVGFVGRLGDRLSETIAAASTPSGSSGGGSGGGSSDDSDSGSSGGGSSGGGGGGGGGSGW